MLKLIVLCISSPSAALPSALCSDLYFVFICVMTFMYALFCCRYLFVLLYYMFYVHKRSYISLGNVSTVNFGLHKATFYVYVFY